MAQTGTHRTAPGRRPGSPGSAAATGTDPTPAQQQALAIYLNDHLAGLTGVVELARRAARGEGSSPLAPPLRTLAADLAADRDALRELMGRLGVRVAAYKVGGGWVAEKLGRLKLNGAWLHRSALAPVVELEGLGLGIAANAATWRVLRGLAASAPALDPVDDVARLDRLLDRSAQQAALVERLGLQAAASALGGRLPG